MPVAEHSKNAADTVHAIHMVRASVKRVCKTWEEEERGREYNNLPYKMHCDSIIMRRC